MTDGQELRDQVPAPRIDEPSRGPSLSLIWLVPIVTAVIALSLAYRYYVNLGPVITIVFSSAEGLEAGRTPIKRLNVEIGRVEKITLDESLNQVLVSARMVKDAEEYLNEHTRFWVVRPRIGLTGITGLQTLVSGSYIELDSTPGGTPREVFVGLEEPPLTPEGAPGIRVRLHAEEAGSVDAGSPVFYRRLKVGRVESRRLSDNGEYVEFEAFIDAPYHTQINTNTRFWNSSGFEVSLGAEGVNLRSETLEAVVSGGVSFFNPPRLRQGNPIETGALFTLYPNRHDAESQPAESALEHFGFVLHFQESLRGLKVGAPVELRGVKIGYVADIDIQYNPDTDRVEVPVLVFLEPGRIRGIENAPDIEGGFPAAVGRGWRARLQSGSLLTGSLYVELVQVPDASPAQITGSSGPYKVFPTTPSPFSQITESATRFLATLNALPLDDLVESASRLVKDADALLRVPADDELGADAIAIREQLSQAPLQQLAASMTSTLAGIDAITGSPEAQKLPTKLNESLAQLNATLKTTRNLLEGDSSVSPLYFELSNALQELTRAARAVRSLTETLEDKPNALIFGK